MMHPNNTSTISLSGVDGLLSAVPALLGFHPAESLVLLCLAGPRRRVGPVLRIDLPSTAGPAVSMDAQTWASLASTAARYADEVAVIVYTDQPNTVDLDVLRAAMDRVCPVLDVIAVPNNPHQVSAELVAANACQGRAVLTSREQLARSVEHQQEMAPAPVLAELASITGRDALIARMLPDPDAVATLVTAAQSTPNTDPPAADVCAALAVLAYRHGNGALAQVAIDRTLRTAPDHRLAHLMLAVMATGMPPADLDTLTTL